MKKVLIVVLTLILSAAITISALACNERAKDVLQRGGDVALGAQQSESGKALNKYLACRDNGGYGNFIDEDSDGICDNKEKKQDCGPGGAYQTSNFVDEDNDGICDNMDGRRECELNCVCQAREFADIANDCICDDCEHKQKGLCLEGFGQADNNFTDNDNNGVCDNKDDNCGTRCWKRRGSSVQNKWG